MSGLQAHEVGLVEPDGLFELLDVFRAPFSKGGLSLSVSLLALFRGCVDLGWSVSDSFLSHMPTAPARTYRLPAAFSLWLP